VPVRCGGRAPWSERTADSAHRTTSTS
jgi:hypothetical protein